MELNITAKTIKEIEEIKGITGSRKLPENIIRELCEKAIEDYISDFRNSEGRIEPQKVLKLPTEYEVRRFENDYRAVHGKLPKKSDVEDFRMANCTEVILLNENPDIGAPYCTVYDETGLYKCGLDKIIKPE